MFGLLLGIEELANVELGPAFEAMLVDEGLSAFLVDGDHPFVVDHQTLSLTRMKATEAISFLGSGPAEAGFRAVRAWIDEGLAALVGHAGRGFPVVFTVLPKPGTIG